MHKSTQGISPVGCQSGLHVKVNRFVVCTLLFITACAPTESPTKESVQTPMVVTTRFLALLTGKLVMVDGCLRVEADYSNVSYLIAWPPDFDATVTDKAVEITDNLSGEKTTWHVGDRVNVGGGELGSLDSQMQQRLPVNCQGPYWVFGGWPKDTPMPK